MPDLIPIAHRRHCPKCEKNTMDVSILNAMVGRKGFISESCIECGYIHTYTMTIPWPIWYWVLISIIIILVCLGLYKTF